MILPIAPYWPHVGLIGPIGIVIPTSPIRRLGFANICIYKNLLNTANHRQYSNTRMPKTRLHAPESNICVEKVNAPKNLVCTKN